MSLWMDLTRDINDFTTFHFMEVLYYTNDSFWQFSLLIFHN